MAGKTIYYPTFETLNIKDFVFELIRGIGWESYFEIDCLVFVELVREFYTTCQFKKVIDFNLKTWNLITF